VAGLRAAQMLADHFATNDLSAVIEDALTARAKQLRDQGAKLNLR